MVTVVGFAVPTVVQVASLRLVFDSSVKPVAVLGQERVTVAPDRAAFRLGADVVPPTGVVGSSCGFGWVNTVKKFTSVCEFGPFCG